MTTTQKRANPYYNILFNILLPVFVLNQVTKKFGENGPLIALILALSIPLTYGIWDYLSNQHKNFLSLLGIANILVTGTLALLRLEGIWFAVKEAAFPLILGLGVFASAFTKNPAIRFIALNDQFLKIDLLNAKLAERNSALQFQNLLRTSTLLLTSSFLLSSLLNFLVAIRIFSPLPAGLSQLEQEALLNGQIEKMTWMGFLVISLPLMAFMGLLFWHLFSGIKKLTGLELQDILVDQSKSS